MLKLVIAAACLGAAVAQAQAADLSGQEINELLAGATVELDTPVGTKLPLRYGRDGKLSGEARGLAWYLGAATDRGRWWVDGGQLCHRWSRWLGSEPQCLRLRKEGRVIRWRTPDGTSGTATITVPPVKHVAAALADAPPSPSKEATPRKSLPEPVKGPEKQAGAPTPGAGQPSAAEEAPPKHLSQELPSKEAGKDTAPPQPAPVLGAPEKTTPPESQHESQPESLAEPVRPAQRVYKVANVRSDDVLNVRIGPSADFDIVGALPPGARGIAITSACRSQWCPVKHRATSGWVNSAYLSPEGPSGETSPPDSAMRDSPEAPRSCLTAAVRALLARIEQQFGPVQVVSTCRPGATIRGTFRPSRHASGNAVDFKAGSRKGAIVAWLIANHRRGGTMTYPGLDHIHVDIGPHFVSVAGGPRWASWRSGQADLPGPR
jgi:hypothetical protein